MWYSLVVENNNLVKRIMDAFMPKYIGSGRPIDMAIFQSTNANSDTRTIFFSPKASSLALQFGASPFDGVFIDMDLSLLVGDQAAIDSLFPDVDKNG